MNWKVSVALIATIFRKWKTFQGYAPYRQSRTPYQRNGARQTLLLHTANRKYHMAYRFVPFPTTLDDLEGHSPVAGLIKYKSMNMCAPFHTVSTELTRRVASRCPSAIAEFLVTYWYSIFTLGMRPVLWRNGVTSWCHSSRNTRWFNESGPGDLFTLKMFNLWSITSSLKVAVSYGFVGHRDGSTVNVPSLSHVYTPAK